MSHLPEEHPDAFKYVSSGGLSVQFGNSNPFGRVPVDQTYEETVIKHTQTSVRRHEKGLSLKPNAFSKYYFVAEYRSTFLMIRQLRDMLHINSSSPKHNDSFNPELQDFVFLSNGKVAPASEVQDDLLRVKDVGEEVYQAVQRTASQMWSAKCKIPRHHEESQAQDLYWTQQEDKS